MKILILILTIVSLVKSAYDKSPLVPMSEYQENYRTLSGWECFEANGKFCHDVNHGSMIRVTGSSNYGHGVCCKPDYAGEHCNNDGDHRCSQPVAEADTSELYKPIITKSDMKNHQMFAFLPKISPQKCGIPIQNLTDFQTNSTADIPSPMRLYANSTI